MLGFAIRRFQGQDGDREGGRPLGDANLGGEEKIGGKLHLTTYRLVFYANSANRVVGRFSMFLPTLQQVKNASFIWDRRMAVSTQSKTVEFQVWGIKEVASRINSAKEMFNAASNEQLIARLTEEYPKLGEEFDVSHSKLIQVVEGTAELKHLLEGLHELRH